MFFNQVNNKNMYISNDGKVMLSYGKIIVIKHYDKIYLNYDFYDFSKTTAKHRNYYLDVNSKEFNKNMKNGCYIFLTNNEMLELFYNIYSRCF